MAAISGSDGNSADMAGVRSSCGGRDRSRAIESAGQFGTNLRDIVTENRGLDRQLHQTTNLQVRYLDLLHR